MVCCGWQTTGRIILESDMKQYITQLYEVMIVKAALPVFNFAF